MDFQPPPGYQPTYNPIIPYSAPIYGGLKEGMAVYIQGTPERNIKHRFDIILMTGLEGVLDYALHFNCMLDINLVRLNANKDGSWISEERPEISFHNGEDFQLLFIVTSEGYQVSVNGGDYHLYKHRMPIEKVCALSIDGGVSVHIININGGGIGHIQGYPGLGQMVGIPFSVPIYGGLRMGMSVHIKGLIQHDGTRFHVSLQTAEAKCSDKALYINPRLRPNKFVVFNTFKNQEFEEQEKATDMPFTVGESFDLVIMVTEQGYQVNVNGREFYMFKHRMPYTRVLALGIGGDVSVDSVNITGGGHGPMLAWPGPKYIGDKPHTQPIPGGLKAGMSLYVRGTIPSKDISRFDVKLEAGDDTAIHCKTLFKGERGVVFNTHENGAWQTEEKMDGMPFFKGKSFELVFVVTSEGYQVLVDGNEVHMYKHRLPLDTVTDLVISGEVSVKTISIITEQGKDPAPEVVNEQSGTMLEYLAPGDVSSSGYSHAVDGGFGPETTLYFEGTVHSGTSRFHVELSAGTDIVITFNPRFGGSNVVVMDSRENGSWLSAEKNMENPFREGEEFQLAFIVTQEGYQIIVNGSLFIMYKHRIPADRVDRLSIAGGVTMRSVIINREQGRVQVYPTPGDVKTDEYTKTIEGGLNPGMILQLRGTVHAGDVKRSTSRARIRGGFRRGGWMDQEQESTILEGFKIDLVAGENIALSFNPKFSGWTMVVMNSRKDGKWNAEERPSWMPFKEDEDFDLRLNVTSIGYQVVVNGLTLAMYEHRIPVDQVTSLLISGDVSIEYLAIIKTSLGSGGSGYNWRFLPMMTSQPIYNPPVPYTRMIPGGMTPKRTIAFSGRVLPDANRITFNFYVSSTGDLALYFNPWLHDASVVRNSCLCETWGLEERDIKFNPFQKGEHFEILIRCGLQKLKVFGNGKYMFTFYHRVHPISKVDKLEIKGDLHLSHIIM